MIQIKRAYEAPARGDGRRILVERLWPRGIKKTALEADAWLKDVAPSTELRKWFAHRVERWPEFERRYRAELDANPEAWHRLLDADDRTTLTLLYSAHDEAHNSAVVLRDYLTRRRRRSRGSRVRQSAQRSRRSQRSQRSQQSRRSRRSSLSNR
jgi:uncharacterized protein YeaO (DUF488 family)